MLKNYILTAWKVFLRRKFFTFVNLFGICLTLTIIMVAISIVDGFIYPEGPGRNSDNYRIINKLILTNKDRSSTQSTSLGYKFIQDNVLRLKTPELISYYTRDISVNKYVEDKKYTFQIRYTDANYWDVLNFELLDGRFYGPEELEKGELVAVVNETIGKEFFNGQSPVGQDLLINDLTYRVIGLVQDVARNDFEAYSNVWMPYTTQPSSSYQQQTMGNWHALLYHSDESKMSEISNEYAYLLQNDVILNKVGGYIEAFGGAFGKLDSIARSVFSREFEYTFQSGKERLMIIILLITLLFMALPAINLINLNVSRTLERSSEIGVRKAFGASSRHLVRQFIVESILLTMIGGAIAMLISYWILELFEGSGLIPYASFGFSFRVFVYGFLMILLFSLVSGSYPAFKMSRLHPVSALKGV